MKILTWTDYRIRAYIRAQKIKRNSAKGYSDKLIRYAGRSIIKADDINKKIYDEIISGRPFLAGRFGSTELLNMQTYDFGAHGKYSVEDRFNQLCKWYGFFPEDISLLPEFVDMMKKSCAQVDYFGVWFQPFEDYYIKNICKSEIKLTYLLDLEPWSSNDIHWSAALKGKRVLVIHPFEYTIFNQYTQRRTELFPGTDILPEFDLLTVKAVQTLAGTKDDRFANWFEALDWMYEEAVKKDFDIAIIGCGAYGLPLAARLKDAGKQAIHLAGATQLLFGIKGRRWEENKAFEYIQNRFNDSWVYPNESENLKNNSAVEGGCYWK